jgi:hypothetical protein
LNKKQQSSHAVLVKLGPCQSADEQILTIASLLAQYIVLSSYGLHELSVHGPSERKMKLILSVILSTSQLRFVEVSNKDGGKDASKFQQHFTLNSSKWM